MNTRKRLTLVDLDVTIISGETSLALASVIIDLIDACSYEVHVNEMILFLSVNYVQLYTHLTFKGRNQLAYPSWHRYRRGAGTGGVKGGCEMNLSDGLFVVTIFVF